MALGWKGTRLSGLRTHRFRWAFGILPLLLVFAPPAPRASADPAEMGGLSGRVRDAVGNSLTGVEILIVSPARGVEPLEVVRSGPEGRFRFRELDAGIYRVAALKDGYRTFVGQVNTRLQSWLDVVLRPATVSEETELVLPRDTSWAMRLPRRSVLREIDKRPDPAGDEPSGLTPGVLELLGAPIQIQVDQTYARNIGPRGGEGEERDGQSSETRLNVASRFGERGSIQLQGSRRSFDSASGSQVPISTARRDDTSLGLAFSYDTNRDSRVAVQASFDRQDLSLAPEADGSAAPLRQERQSWSYDAAWTKQIDAASSLAVKIGFEDTTLQGSTETLDGPDREGLPADGTLSNRSVGAVGSFESLPVADHRVEVGFRARLVDAPVPIAPSRDIDPGGTIFHAAPGFSLGLDARDTWSVAGPFAFVYGLGYRHALGRDDVSLIVPSAGGTWWVSDMMVRFLVSYHRVEARAGSELAEGDPLFRPDRAFGYEAEIEIPLPAGLRLSGSTRSVPLQLDFLASEDGGSTMDSRPIYLTDGNASLDRNRLAIVREASGTRTHLELARGRVEGTIAPVLPYELPFLALSNGRLDYVSGQLGVRVAASGTDVRVDYRRVLDRSSGVDGSGDDSDLHSLEVRLGQDMMRIRSLGTWRFLLAARTTTIDGENPERWLPANDESSFRALNHELSAGLSVLF